MRTIKFRAFKLGTKEFVYGLLSTYKFGYFNIEGFRVKMETIGQFTGLLDIENNEIYEGDILQMKPGNNFVVEYIDGSFNIAPLRDNKICEDSFMLYQSRIELLKLKVIGNIHESQK